MTKNISKKVCVYFSLTLSLIFIVSAWNHDLVKKVSVDVTKAKISIFFGCSEHDFLNLNRKFLNSVNQYIRSVNLNSNFSLLSVMKSSNYAKTFMAIDCTCKQCMSLLTIISSYRAFNKSYSWVVFDGYNFGVEKIFENVLNIGLNSELIYVNRSSEEIYSLYDVYSKGRHLKAPLEIISYGEWNKTDENNKIKTFKDLYVIQGIRHRNNFHRLTLRGVTVIDRDNVSINEIDKVLTNRQKIDGVAQFVKYHYTLVSLLRDKLNFTIKYRITRGWAGRLGPKRFRLGLLGVVQRNEADIAASGAFSKINRLAEFDTIHQNWKFEAGFLFRVTSELKVKDDKFGNFLTPFESRIWHIVILLMFIIGIIWRCVDIIQGQYYINDITNHRLSDNFMGIMAAICQQGLHPISSYLAPRIIALCLIVLCLILYNYYTSSVVGSLISDQSKGPQNLEQIIDSPLLLSFEDIGYHKVIFKESNLSVVKRLYNTKVHVSRISNIQLPVYSQLKKAIPFIKKGGYAFHCELIEAFPEIAKVFDASEICDLRYVSGLFDVQILNLIVPKKSQYTEIFRIIMHYAREVGIVNRILKIYRPEIPKCQASSTVHPVTLSGVLNAFALLGVGMFISVLILLIEIIYNKKKKKRSTQCKKYSKATKIKNKLAVTGSYITKQ